MLQTKGLTKKYASTVAVQDLNITIEDHQVAGLLGPNGAGKSTSMRMMTGYLAPTSGQVTVAGLDVHTNPLKARKEIGYLPEILPLYLDFTVQEQLRFVCSLREIGAREQNAEIDRVCSALNILDVQGRLIRHLSKGYRQRVGFAAALIGSPSFLILDEPTSGLDPAQVLEIRELINHLSDHMSVLISSHILSEIASVCDCLFFLREGRLLAHGSKNEILRANSVFPVLEIVTTGSKELSRQLFGQISPNTKVEELPALEDNCQRWILSPENGKDIRSDVFQAFAAYKDQVSLIEIHYRERTLEEAYLALMSSPD